MTRPRRPRPERFLPLLILALAGCGQGRSAPPRQAEDIGLYSSLPIAWNESEDIRGLLSDDRPSHWALTLLRDRGHVTALDTIARPDGTLPLPRKGILVLAQPRAFTPQENVALDAWVRAGGRVLLFVDPMLTAHTEFAPGDPRRPQDVAMLSPILARWGLTLEFDEAQPAEERTVAVNGAAVPVHLAGQLRPSGKAGDAVAKCGIEARGLIADCRSGQGRIVALADAALLETPQDSSDLKARQAILSQLLDRLAS